MLLIFGTPGVVDMLFNYNEIHEYKTKGKIFNLSLVKEF